MLNSLLKALGLRREPRRAERFLSGMITPLLVSGKKFPDTLAASARYQQARKLTEAGIGSATEVAEKRWTDAKGAANVGLASAKDAVDVGWASTKDAADAGWLKAKDAAVVGVASARERAKSVDVDGLREKATKQATKLTADLASMGIDVKDATLAERDRIRKAVHVAAQEARDEAQKEARRGRAFAVAGFTLFGVIAGILIGRELFASEEAYEPDFEYTFPEEEDDTTNE